ncbi:FG-GAP repeat domain-containing protein [Varibaculum prostatecancerukia]|uniref:FG-GAP repeat domain-containing protein n=1 Tax=Varibaculum prostatecancerukia TaxID=2811781 RepID=UPI001C0032A4|nr:VCBS repeat-containing protein [Varibaculum prostatecancerukia]
MSNFSPDEEVNSSSSEPDGSGDSRFSPDSEPSPDTIAANTVGLPETSPVSAEPAAPGVMPGGENAPYSPNPQDTVYTQTYPQYPTATPAAPGAYPPVTPPIPPAYPGQPMPGGSGPVPPAYPVSQPMPPNIPGKTVPPVYPGQPVPSGKGKSRRGLIVTLCVILVLALCVLGITLFKVFTGEDSLAVGVKPAWDNAATVELEPEGEPALAYTLYWSGKDKLILIQPSKDGSGIAQMLDPKTGAKTGSPIVLPKCVSSLKYPYQIKNEKIVCATKENFRANSNKKYHFKERIYADKRLIVGASPSATNARQIVAYNPKTSKLLWVQNLKKPSSVTCNGKGIYTTSTSANSNTTGKQKLDVMVYTGSSQAQKSPDKQLGQPQKSKPKETKPQVAKDAIKNIDFANAYLPMVSYGCFEENIWQESDRTPIINKMPDETSHCWATMQNGESSEKSDPFDLGELSSDVKLTPRNEIGELFDSENSFIGDDNKPYGVGYADVNNDGYLDALVVAYDGEAASFILALFDPEDPEHPYMTVIGGTQQGARIELTPPGTITVFEPNPSSGKMDKIQTQTTIKGHEVTDFISSYPNAG